MIKLSQLLLLLIFYTGSFAQPKECVLQEPLIKIDFGSSVNKSSFDFSFLSNYRIRQGNCPDDGEFSFTSYTEDCFYGDWFDINEDHTPGDNEGRMMVVNASVSGGQFFKVMVINLKPGATYELSSWLMNVCRLNGSCSPLPPDISMKLKTTSGRKIVEFNTGPLLQQNFPQWKKYAGYFTMPANESSLVLSMDNETTGGCGNDFALDDIAFSECLSVSNKIPVKLVPVISKQVKKTDRNDKPAPKKEVVKTTPAKPVKVVPANPDLEPRPATNIISKTTIDPPSDLKPTSGKSVELPLPQPLATRTSTIAKRIETPAAEITIDLYDNGDIDGDTVSIYHNNMLIVSRAGLSEKATRFKVKVDAEHPHHELTMVANNLGSIPPNTALMVVTAKGKRTEVFLSSSEEKNARVIIDLAE